jgi:hypothetical protein
VHSDSLVAWEVPRPEESLNRMKPDGGSNGGTVSRKWLPQAGSADLAVRGGSMGSYLMRMIMQSVFSVAARRKNALVRDRCRVPRRCAKNGLD